MTAFRLKGRFMDLNWLTQFWVTILIGAVLIFLVSQQMRIRYWIALLQEYGLKTTFLLEKCHKIYNKLYENVNAMKISMKEREEKKITGDATFVYGEVTFYSFASILALTKPQPGEVFYDLGCGGGKAVFIAGLIYDLKKSCGVEKLDGLYRLCIQLLDKLKNMPEMHHYLPNKKINVEFLHKDLRDQDISDGDIIFMNATCFSGELWDEIFSKLLTLKTGSRVILGTKEIHHAHFDRIHAGLHLMSWGLNSINIYVKV